MQTLKNSLLKVVMAVVLSSTISLISYSYEDKVIKDEQLSKIVKIEKGPNVIIKISSDKQGFTTGHSTTGLDTSDFYRTKKSDLVRVAVPTADKKNTETFTRLLSEMNKRKLLDLYGNGLDEDPGAKRTVAEVYFAGSNLKVFAEFWDSLGEEDKKMSQAGSKIDQYVADITTKFKKELAAKNDDNQKEKVEHKADFQKVEKKYEFKEIVEDYPAVRVKCTTLTDAGPGQSTLLEVKFKMKNATLWDLISSDVEALLKKGEFSATMKDGIVFKDGTKLDEKVKILESKTEPPQ